MMRDFYDRITDSDKAELDKLNKAIDRAVERRTIFLDNKMKEYADVPIGGELYNLLSKRRVGIVKRHYRFWRGRDWRYDNSFSIDYE
jgi:hypothetical protein